MAGPVNSARRPRRIPLEQKRASATPEPPPPPAKRPQYTCCDTPDVGEDDGRTVCFSCATIHEEGAIVSEVQFGETSGGRATLQGGTVGNDQRFANSMGGQVAGISGGSSRQTTIERGRSAIQYICSKLHIGVEEPVHVHAPRWYQLALNHSFVQGRGIFKVAAAAVYLASRKNKGSTVLLMDLAEAISVNVWQLGTVYRDFCKVLMADDSSGHTGTDVLDIEPLMLKFCEKLEFGQDSFKVAADACLVLKRMSRDWMVQGRNPAGLCAACIILAAGMNNFRRTVRELVYVCRVADTTINQRLYEYRRTQSAALTVKQFREFGPKLKTKIAPPSVYKREEREQREAARKRKAEALENGDEEDFEGDGGDEEVDGADENGEDNTPQSVPSKPTKRQAAMIKKQKANSGEAIPTPADGDSQDPANREGSDDMVVDIDALAGDDIDAGLDALANAEDAVEADGDAIAVPKKKRGRPPKKKREPVVILDEDLEVEQMLEDEINTELAKWEDTFKEFKDNESHQVFKDTLEKARKLVSLHQPDRDINGEEDIGEDEFGDDPDVKYAELSPEESQAKERIWLVDNEDWLRQQQMKLLQKALAEASGNPKKPKQKRKKTVMGDGSVLEGRPAASAAEAHKLMIQKRAKQFSSGVNYDVFRSIAGEDTSSSGTATPVGQAVEKPEVPAYQAVPVGEGDEEEEEEVVEEQYAEEEEDLEHQYLSDEEEGFDENLENWDDY